MQSKAVGATKDFVSRVGKGLSDFDTRSKVVGDYVETAAGVLVVESAHAHVGSGALKIQMQDRFRTAFYNDARGMPRGVWSTMDDIPAIYTAAKETAFQPLRTFATMPLVGWSVGRSVSQSVYSSIQCLHEYLSPPLPGSPAACTLRSEG